VGEHTDVCVWPCGTWCFRSELEEMLNHHSDDYSIIEIPDGVDDIDAFIAGIGG